MKKKTYSLFLLACLALAGVNVTSTGCFRSLYYPEACISAPENGTARFPVSFSSACSRRASSFEWDFGDSTASTEPDPVHTYDSAGRYRVTLTVRGNNPNRKSLDFVLIEIN